MMKTQRWLFYGKLHPYAYKRSDSSMPTNIKNGKEVWIYKTKNIILRN